MGALDGATYKEGTLQLGHGDALVMFTDGVTEAKNQKREEFGTERLDAILKGMPGKSSQQIIENVKTGITNFVAGADQHDDITMLVLKRK